jgi:hypothetical protein
MPCLELRAKLQSHEDRIGGYPLPHANPDVFGSSE